jgi:hypothetical protein
MDSMLRAPISHPLVRRCRYAGHGHALHLAAIASAPNAPSASDGVPTSSRPCVDRYLTRFTPRIRPCLLTVKRMEPEVLTMRAPRSARYVSR